MHQRMNQHTPQQQQAPLQSRHETTPNQWRVIKTTKYTPQRPNNKIQESLLPFGHSAYSLVPERQRSFTGYPVGPQLEPGHGSLPYEHQLSQQQNGPKIDSYQPTPSFHHQPQQQVPKPDFYASQAHQNHGSSTHSQAYASAPGSSHLSQLLQQARMDSHQNRASSTSGANGNENRQLSFLQKNSAIQSALSSHQHQQKTFFQETPASQQYQRSHSFKVQALKNQNFVGMQKQQFGSPPPHQYHYTSTGQNLLYPAQDQFLSASEDEDFFNDQDDEDDSDQEGEEEDQDDEYRNEALVDFPSDADIVSLEQTPKRQNERQGTSASGNIAQVPNRLQESPQSNLQDSAPALGSRQASYSSNTIHMQQMPQARQQPQLRLNSLLKAFQKQLASGQTQQTNNTDSTLEKSSRQEADKENGRGHSSKVQLTEPARDKKDQDPFNKASQLAATQGGKNQVINYNSTAQTRQKSPSALSLQQQQLQQSQKYLFRTPPPAISKKNIFRLDEGNPNGTASQVSGRGATLFPNGNNQIEASQDLPQMRMVSKDAVQRHGKQRSPHFNEGRLIVAQVGEDGPPSATAVKEQTYYFQSVQNTRQNTSQNNFSQDILPRAKQTKMAHFQAQENLAQRKEALVLRESVQVLSEQVCLLKAEIATGEYVVHELMRKNRDLKQAMILQSEMLRSKEFVTCQLKTVAAENFELKQQNAKLWTVIERQRSAFFTAQEELDQDREESERLFEELQTENERLRDLLKISDSFHGAATYQQLSESMQKAENELQAHTQTPTESSGASGLQQMVAEASAQIKKLALDRKRQQQRVQEEIAEQTAIATPVNGKRTIQPKKAFLLAAGSADGLSSGDDSSDDDEKYANETEEERKARKEASRFKREQQMLLDQIDGVPLKKESDASDSKSSSSGKRTTIFNLDSAF